MTLPDPEGGWQFLEGKKKGPAVSGRALGYYFNRSEIAIPADSLTSGRPPASP